MVGVGSSTLSPSKSTPLPGQVPECYPLLSGRPCDVIVRPEQSRLHQRRALLLTVSAVRRMLPEIQLPADCWSRPLGQGSKDPVKQLEAFAVVPHTPLHR